MDKFEGLVVSSLMRPHAESRADLHQPFFDVKDELVEVRPDCASVEGEPLVFSSVAVVASHQGNSLVGVASRNLDDGARLGVDYSVLIQPPHLAVHLVIILHLMFISGETLF